MTSPWVRVSELWYASLDDWRAANIDAAPAYTPPPWTRNEPFLDIGSTFIACKPDVDFLKDNPTIP